MHSMIENPSRKEEKIIEKGVRSSDIKYQRAELSAPQLVRQVPLANASFVQSSFIEIIPNRETSAFLSNFKDSGAEGWVQFDITVWPTAESQGYTNGWAKVESYRLFDRVEHTVNGTLVNSQDLFLPEMATSNLVDRPVQELWSQLAPAGIDVNPGYVENPFTSCIDLGGKSTRLDSYPSTQFTVSSGATGSVVIPTATSSTYSIPNGLVQFGTPRRFCLPFSLLFSSLLNDSDSLVPLAALHDIRMFVTSNATQAMYEVTTTPSSEGTPASTPRALSFSISAVEMWYPRTYAMGFLQSMSDEVIRSNNWSFRTEQRKTQNIQVQLGSGDSSTPVAGQVTVNFGRLSYSARQLTAFLVSSNALSSALTASKSHFCQNGIYQWAFTSKGQLYPYLMARSGYADPLDVSTNKRDGFMYYQNATRSKKAQKRDYCDSSQTAITPWAYDGQSHVAYNNTYGPPGTWTMFPQCGVYATNAQSISIPNEVNIPQTIDQWRANSQRLFKMTVDLNSVTNDDSFISGTSVDQLQLLLYYTGLRDRYVDASGAVRAASICQCLLDMRVNALVKMGVSDCLIEAETVV